MVDNFAPGVTQPTRAFQPMGVGNMQGIHDTKYATRQLAAAAIPAVTNFFSAAPVADITSDRYPQGNTLVTSGAIFRIYSILVHVVAGAAGTVLGDIQKVIDGCALRIVTSQKEYGVFPIFMLPAGGGIAIQSGQVAVTPAAAPGAVSPLGAINGMPSRDAALTLGRPLEIQANQAFYMELLGPNAAGVYGALTLTGAVNVRVVLDGVEIRTAA